jgi:hypothetical protein
MMLAPKSMLCLDFGTINDAGNIGLGTQFDDGLPASLSRELIDDDIESKSASR